MRSSDSSTAGFRDVLSRRWAGWFTVLVLAIIAGVRLTALNFPLERDEGEYAYAGQLLLQGIPPYQLAYSMKFPGADVIYALFMALFGQTPAAIHFGVILVTTWTAVMLYWLGKKMLDSLTAMVAATTYAVLATESGMFGMQGHATHFAAFFVTAGLCALEKARSDAHWLRAGTTGVLFGMAIVVKQNAAFLAGWAALVLAWDAWRDVQTPLPRRLARLAAAGVGMLLPFGVCCLLLWHAGVFGKFWFWTVDYARQYVAIRPLSSAWAALKFNVGEIAEEDYLLWTLAVAGAGLIWLDDRLRSVRLRLLGLAAASALTTVPGFYFRTHYFLLTLPAAALLAGGAVAALRQVWNRHWGRERWADWPVTAGYGLLLVLTLWQNQGVWSLFARAQGAHVFLAHAFYGDEPFPEAPLVADFIRTHSSPDARIAVLGSEPEIYFLARRHSATGYIYTYALMEPQPYARQMQAEMIREIESCAPQFIVFTRADSSWLPTLASPWDIFRWWEGYQTNYTRVGVVDILWPGKIRFAWNQAAAHYGPLKGSGFEVYQRPAAASTRAHAAAREPRRQPRNDGATHHD
jgi:hypothetical protein